MFDLRSLEIRKSGAITTMYSAAFYPRRLPSAVCRLAVDIRRAPKHTQSQCTHSGAMYDRRVLPDMTGLRPDSTISLVRFDPVKEMDILRVGLNIMLQ